MAFQHKNNGTSKLSGSLTTGAVTLSVQTGEGSRFPLAGGSDWFPLTILKADGTFEIVKCTSRTGDVFTIVRAQESTAALAFNAGERVELRLTSAALDTLLQAIQQANATDTTAGALMAVGAFGLGILGAGIDIGNIDSTTLPAGLYVYGYPYSPSGTKPTGSLSNGLVFVERFSGTIIKQTWTDINDGSAFAPRTWVRTSHLASTWGDWSEVILGAKQSYSTDATVGSLMLVGAFGLGAPGPSITDANAIPVGAAGCYSLNTPFTNAPPPGGLHSIIQYTHGGSQVQLAITAGSLTPKIWIRGNNGSWGAWELVHGTITGVTNCNAISVDGQHLTTTSATNMPGPTLTGWIIEHYGGSGTIRSQTARAFGDGGISYSRGYNTGAWNPWILNATEDRTWQDVSGSRVSGTTYTNSTGRSIEVAVCTVNGSVSTANVNGVVRTFAGGSAGTTAHQNTSFTVPPGDTYSVSFGGTIIYWHELR